MKKETPQYKSYFLSKNTFLTMKYALFVIFGLLTPCLVKSQDTTLNKCIVKFNATALINPAFPAIKMGVEKPLSDRLSISGEIGYKFTNLRNHRADTSFLKPRGYSGNIECRYYLKNHNITKKPARNYLAINLFYTEEQYNLGVTYTDITDTTKTLEPYGDIDVLTVDKKKWGVNLIYGKQRQLTKRWILDAYVGLGLRQKTVVNTHREYDKKKHILSGYDLIPYFDSLDMSESSGLNVSFTMGIRLGFVLK
jgi:hypothetical protein